ncbi:MAG TPA: NAD-dependent epimerase/dehydratase family protein [Casimicrobiaceae bacterium]|nr:NAD-dependent epimerase/dehydratase family protein [Casimicrobiaceae bacterium]
MAVTPQIRGKVLVTGAHGFIGRALCRHLAALGVAHVKTVRTPAFGDPDANAAIVGDLAAADWDEALVGVDSIVHLAGRAHIRKRDAGDPTPYVVANVHVTRRLCDAAVRAKVRRIVLASSVKVYGESTRIGRPFRGGDPAAPRDAYAHSKAEAERVLWQACEGNRIEGVVLRLPLTYGAGVKGNFLTLIEAIAARRRLPLAGIGNRRSLLNVDNAVSAIAAALTVPALAGLTLPIADKESVSTSELAERLGHALGVPARLFHLPKSLLRAGAALTGKRAIAARLLGSLEVDAQQFGELAGWSQPYTLDEGLAATAAWWRLRHAL